MCVCKGVFTLLVCVCKGVFTLLPSSILDPPQEHAFPSSHLVFAAPVQGPTMVSDLAVVWG
jgi:hypothetical protein